VVAILLDDKIIKVIAPAEPKTESGTAVNLSFNQAVMRFFDPETGLRI
jgi:hypothetical protein